MTRLLSMEAEFKLDFVKQLSHILPQVRGGTLGEKKLASFLSKVQESPFNKESITNWLNFKEGELNTLSQYLDVLERTQGMYIQ